MELDLTPFFSECSSMDDFRQISIHAWPASVRMGLHLGSAPDTAPPSKIHPAQPAASERKKTRRETGFGVAKGEW